jgi:hypothetical protein
VLVNQDLTPSVQEALVRQLFITQVLDGTTFDAQVAQDPAYLMTLKQQQHRTLVIRPLTETQHRDLFDVVLFVKTGLASVEYNKFGPPGLTLPVVKLYWGVLGLTS